MRIRSVDELSQSQRLSKRIPSASSRLLKNNSLLPCALPQRVRGRPAVAIFPGLFVKSPRLLFARREGVGRPPVTPTQGVFQHPARRQTVVFQPPARGVRIGSRDNGVTPVDRV